MGVKERPFCRFWIGPTVLRLGSLHTVWGSMLQNNQLGPTEGEAKTVSLTVLWSTRKCDVLVNLMLI
jgi:hypothetical protein